MIEVEGERFLAIFLFLWLMKVLTEYLQVTFSVKMRQIFPSWSLSALNFWLYPVTLNVWQFGTLLDNRDGKNIKSQKKHSALNQFQRSYISDQIWDKFILLIFKNFLFEQKITPFW